METLIWVLVPLAISGLGFITYRHPPIARNILAVLIWILLAIIIGEDLHYFGQKDAFISADSVVMNRLSIQDTSIIKINAVRDTIHTKIESLKNEARDWSKSFDVYCFISLVILAVLFILTFVFNDLWKPNSKE